MNLSKCICISQFVTTVHYYTNNKFHAFISHQKQPQKQKKPKFPLKLQKSNKQNKKECSEKNSQNKNPINKQLKNNKQKMNISAQDTLYSYILSTRFYDNIRNKLNGHLSAQQLKQLIKGIQSVSRYKTGQFYCTFDQHVYVIVVYGEILCKGKVYTKGDYFDVDVCDGFQRLGDGDGEIRATGVQMCFLKATTLMLINLQVLEHRIQQIRGIRQNISIIQSSMPTKSLKLSFSDTRKLAKILSTSHIYQRNTKIALQPGIYILYSGIYQLCSSGIPILELQNNFVQITEQLEYQIKLKVKQGFYGYITTEEFYAIVGDTTKMEMERIWRSRMELKGQGETKKKYLEAAEILRDKIRNKLRKSKKFSQAQRIKNDSNHQQQLQNSRRTMLQKCSTAVKKTSYSLGSSRKTTNSTNYHQKTALTWTTPKSTKKLSKTLNLNLYSSQNIDININKAQTLEIQKTQQRLNKMRQFSHRKQKTKLQKDWYHMEEEKMGSSLCLSYFKIKSMQLNPQEANKMCNYKRVHRIYSDPCFRKGLTFRNY